MIPAACLLNLQTKRPAVLRQMESRHIFSNLCVRLRSCPMQSEGLDVLQVLISPPVITRRSITLQGILGGWRPDHSASRQRDHG